MGLFKFSSRRFDWVVVVAGGQLYCWCAVQCLLESSQSSHVILNSFALNKLLGWYEVFGGESLWVSSCPLLAVHNIVLISLPALTCAIYPDHVVWWCSFTLSSYRHIYIEGKLNLMLFCDTRDGSKLIFDYHFQPLPTCYSHVVFDIFSFNGWEFLV